MGKYPLLLLQTWWRIVLVLGVVFFLGAGVFAQDTAPALSSETWMLIHVEASTPEARTTLIQMGIDVLAADLAGVTARVTLTQLAAIKAAGFTYELLPTTLMSQAVDPAYHYFAGTVAELQRVASTYPHITQLSIIGHSIEGRPIYVLKISDHPTLDEEEPEVLFFALTHAREHLSTEMALYIIQFLVEEYGTNGAITNLVNEREIWVMPNVNPDGCVYDIESGYYRSWRKNRRPNDDGSYGVDLNRNYGYRWGCCGGSSSRPSDPNYRGTAPFSEPETAAIRDFVLAHPGLTASISFHTYGEMVFWPFGYTFDPLPEDMNPIDHTAFVAIGQAMAAMNGYQAMQASQLYITDGLSDDWLYGARGIFAFSFELYPSLSSPPGFYPPGSIIARETRRNRSAIEYFLGVADNPRKVAGVGGDVEAPAVVIQEPSANAYVWGELHITVEASDDVGVTLVEFLINGQPVMLDSQPPYEAVWAEPSVLGPLTLQARAFDAGQNIGVSEVITVHWSVSPPQRFPLAFHNHE